MLDTLDQVQATLRAARDLGRRDVEQLVKAIRSYLIESLAEVEARAKMAGTPVSRPSLTNRLAAAAGVSEKQARAFLRALPATAAGELKQKDRFSIPGLGTFKKSSRKAREGRHPTTGEPIRIPATRTVTFAAKIPIEADAAAGARQTKGDTAAPPARRRSTPRSAQKLERAAQEPRLAPPAKTEKTPPQAKKKAPSKPVKEKAGASRSRRKLTTRKSGAKKSRRSGSSSRKKSAGDAGPPPPPGGWPPRSKTEAATRRGQGQPRKQSTRASERTTARDAPAGLGALDRAWREKAARDSVAGGDLVDCSVFAPATVAAGEEILIQAFAHLPEGAEVARTQARERDASSVRRGFTTLDAAIQRGSRLTFELQLKQATIEDALQHLVWRGTTASVVFAATIAREARGNLTGRVIVSLDSIPIGRIVFQTTAGSAPADGGRFTGNARRYTSAFISYASKDRAEVIKRVQMLEIQRIPYFQDVLTLAPGARWKRELYKHIDESDVFLLFWSKAAHASKWVRKELDYAAARKQGVEDADPDIVPVIIEGPPPEPPPEGYEYLHFNDRLIYFMQ